MKRISSIRTRFALSASMLILLILIAFGAFVYTNLRFSLHAAVDDTLSLSAGQTAANLNVDNGQILISEPIASDETGSEVFNQSGFNLVVLSEEGALLDAAGPYRDLVPKNSLPASQPSFRTLSETGNRDAIRVFLLPVQDNEQVVGWVVTMKSLGDVEDALGRLLTALVVGGASLAVLAGFAGYFLAARTLAPIDQITSAARRISVEDLSARLHLEDTGDEVSRLAKTFNEMLTRIESGFERERQFTADASHELRTPLAAIQAILSVMQQRERTTQEYQQALADLSDETERLKNLTNSLLSLARTGSEAGSDFQAVDLSTLLEDVAATLQPLAEEKGLAFDLDINPGLQVRGSMESLIRLFVNLLDNAIKYTEHGRVSIRAWSENDEVGVEVQDTGIGIAAEHLPHIFDRFYRVEQSRSQRGTGLGLTLVRQTVQAHAGTVQAQSAPGEGSIFLVILPAEH